MRRIKKYNQALHYCKQDSRDLAIIQLKKVLSLNPKLVKAHRLLALFFICRSDKLELAKKKLCAMPGKVNTNNTTTLRYLEQSECAKQKEKSPSKKPKDDDLISYQSGNEKLVTAEALKGIFDCG